MYKRIIIVIAGNIAEFDDYKILRSSEKDIKLIYADKDNLNSIEAHELVCIGSYYKREDFWYIKGLADARLRKKSNKITPPGKLD